MEDLEQRCVVEMEAIRSIYVKEVTFWQDQGSWKGRFQASPRLPVGFQICAGKGDMAAIANPGRKLFSVTHLPPLDFDIVIPNCYPSTKPPLYTISCSWLSRQQLTRLCQRLDELWVDNFGEEILYVWFNFLDQESLEHMCIESPLELFEEQAGALDTGTDGTHSLPTEGTMGPGAFEEREEEPSASGLGPMSQLDDLAYLPVYVCYCSDPDRECPESKDGLDCRAVQRRRASVDRLLYTLVNCSRRKEQEEFDSSWIQCSVCFSERTGKSFMRLEGCKHTFCRECLTRHLTVQIKEGRVQCIKCLSLDCETKLLPHEVRDLVSEEQYARYEKRLLRVTLESMPDVVYCPRPQCQTPVIKDGNFGHCPRCYYAFCTTCTHEYHGSKPCPIKSVEMRKVHERYRNGNKQTRDELEKRYGKHAFHQALQ